MTQWVKVTDMVTKEVLVDEEASPAEAMRHCMLAKEKSGGHHDLWVSLLEDGQVFAEFRAVAPEAYVGDAPANTPCPGCGAVGELISDPILGTNLETIHEDECSWMADPNSEPYV